MQTVVMLQETQEVGSFRDKTSRVFYHEGDVYRGVNAEALANASRLLSTSFFHRAAAEHKIVETRIVPAETLPAAVRGSWAGILRHERVPFVSYPYEWTFSMLRDAALLHLELLHSALQEGMTLKDATAFNVQWRGARPIFIDVPSFVPWEPGQPWSGYQQFCRLFLYPLFLQAYRRIPFQAWLRGSIDGISVQDARRLLALDFYKPGVFRDVLVHAGMQNHFAKTSRRIHDDLQEVGFHKELILANLRRLTGIVGGLHPKNDTSAWTEYMDTCRYTPEDIEAKKSFVSRAAGQRPRKLVWDLGCNTGEFSKLVAAHAGYVVAVDGDMQVVDELYRSIKTGGPANILPLTMNLADLTPGLGWLGQERKAFIDRGRPDFILGLALIHHLCITANIPMGEWIRWLAGFRADSVIEFVLPEDPMVKRLLLNKEGSHEDYTLQAFETLLEKHFRVTERLPLSSGTRILYTCEVKP